MQLVLVLVVAGVTAPAMAQQAISGPDFVRLVEASLAGGGDVDEVGLAVAGDVDLRSLQSVDRPIRCSQCR
ncbi:MAG: hypothetical protein KJO18_00730, partial [Acidimicrobiia bacterium]|nr:hypothetical protein [Acidimicrobiia bacterium]